MTKTAYRKNYGFVVSDKHTHMQSTKQYFVRCIRRRCMFYEYVMKWNYSKLSKCEFSCVCCLKCFSLHEQFIFKKNQNQLNAHAHIQMRHFYALLRSSSKNEWSPTWSRLCVPRNLEINVSLWCECQAIQAKIDLWALIFKRQMSRLQLRKPLMIFFISPNSSSYISSRQCCFVYTSIPFDKLCWYWANKDRWLWESLLIYCGWFFFSVFSVACCW